MPAGVVPAWYRETILSIALREGFHRCARVAVGHPKNPKKLCLPRKSLACPVLARCLPVVASLLARLSRPRQDGLERSGEGEKETTRTTDAETTETKHGTMGVKRERYSFAHSVKDAEPHTHVWIRKLRLEHLKKHSHLSDPDGGELLLKICGRQPTDPPTDRPTHRPTDPSTDRQKKGPQRGRARSQRKEQSRQARSGDP